MDDDLRAFTALSSPGQGPLSPAQVAQLEGLVRQFRRAAATGSADALVKSGALPLLAKLFLQKQGQESALLGTVQILAGQTLANALASSEPARESYWETVTRDITPQALTSLPSERMWGNLLGGPRSDRRGSCTRVRGRPSLACGQTPGT